MGRSLPTPHENLRRYAVRPLKVPLGVGIGAGANWDEAH
jgi:DNA polymerase I-like protein with 3'-5' exonuclease and polymerase domains